MRLNKYFLFAFIYFFINGLFLPFGFTYTALLAPFFYFWILLTRKKEIIFPFIALLTPFILAQVLYVDVVRKVYFTSLLNLVLVYIFCQAVYTFFKISKDPEKIFRQLLIINFILCLLAVGLYFTPYYKYMWMQQTLSESGEKFRRLRMFVYEPSFYALLFVPIFCFYLLQYFFRQNRMKGILLLLMIFLPLVLSFSLGVIVCLFLAAIITYCIHFTGLIRKRRIANAFVFTGNLLLLLIWPLIFLSNKNILFTRIVSFLSGTDTSGKGRTWDAYILANKLLREKNEYWGIGLGQIKIIGKDIIRSYYLYVTEITVRIPNATAETLAIFGWFGFSLRIFIEIFLFFYTRVCTNYFRLWLFFFIFIYQFTGSFLTNTAEYVVWILAFTNVFGQFNVEQKNELSAFQTVDH